MGKQEKQQKKNVKADPAPESKPPHDPLEKKASPTSWYDNLTDEQKAEEIEKRKKRDEKGLKEQKKAKELLDKKAEEAKEAKKIELHWKDVERQGSRKAVNNKYLLESKEWGDSWYVEHPKGAWLEVKADYFCKLCEKHINKANVQVHLDTDLHKKRVWADENEKTIVFSPPGLELAVPSSAQPTGKLVLDRDVIESRINEWDEPYFFCLACEKIVDDFHLNSEKHLQRVHSYREANKPHEQPDEEWLMWVPWSSEQPQCQAELQMRCLLCEKFCNDEESHGTSLDQKLSQLHRKRLLEYSKYYREAVLRERERYNREYPMVQQISNARTLAMLPWTEDFAIKAEQLKRGTLNPNAAGRSEAVPQQRAENPWTGQTRVPVPDNPRPLPTAGVPMTNGINGHMAPVQLQKNVPVLDEDGFTTVAGGRQQRGANSAPRGTEYKAGIHIAKKDYDGFEKTSDGIVEGGYLSFKAGDRLEKKSEPQRGEPHNRYREYAFFLNVASGELGWIPTCHLANNF